MSNSKKNPNMSSNMFSNKYTRKIGMFNNKSNTRKESTKKNFRNIFRGNVTVSVCTLNQWAMDYIGNEKRIIEAIKKSKSENGKIIVLPELVTTGYSCQDHFYESETYMLSMNIIRRICKDEELTKDILLVLGIPVIHDGVRYNTMTFINNGEIILIRPKINLADDGNYREARWFTSWSKEGLEKFPLENFGTQKSAPIGIAIVNCNGVKIAAEVCEELWIPQSMNIPLYLNDTDIIINSSGSHFEMNKIQKRINLINAATKRAGGAYIYSNLKGCDGERLYFDGGSMIGVNGSIIAIEKRFDLVDVKVLTYPINLDDISEYRLRGSSIQTQSSKVKKIDVIDCKLSVISPLLSRPLKNENSVNIVIDHSEKIKDKKILEDNLFKGMHKSIDDISNKEISEVCEASSCWLWDYLKRSGASGFMLPLSGGADSAVVSLLVYLMCKKVFKDWPIIEDENYEITKRIKLYVNDMTSENICNIILKCVYLPVKGRSFNESKGIETSETYLRSRDIATKIGAVWSSQDITEIYKQAKSILDGIIKNELRITKDKRETGNNTRYSKSSKGVKKIINNGTNINTLNSNAVINTERFPNGLKKQNGTNISKAWSKYGLADENLQARLRMVVNYLLSLALNESGFLLNLSCSNSDEILIGYYTKYDASAGDLNPIGTMPKRFINKALEYYSLLWNSKEYADILIATPTAELSVMKEGARPQTDEDEIGLTYDQIYYFGKLRAQGYGMIKMFNHIIQNLDKKEVKELIIPSDKKFGNNINKIKDYIKEKLGTFFHRYRMNRHKTVILTPSVHLLPSPDDNRFDLRPFLYPQFDVQKEYISQM